MITYNGHYIEAQLMFSTSTLFLQNKLFCTHLISKTYIGAAKNFT